MIKKTILTLVTFLAALSVYGQTSSTVVEEKLNFEAPLFGLSKRDYKPKWTIMTFDELTGGYNHLMGTPDKLTPSGWNASISIISLRYRPWRDGNIFSVSWLLDVSQNYLQKGYAYADNGSILPTPPLWQNVERSTYNSESFGLQIGYTKEFGDWKAGAFVIPTYENVHLINKYSLIGIDGIQHQDKLCNYDNFRLGFKVGAWYQDFGLSLCYKPVIGSPSTTLPQYDALQLGFSVRF